MLLKVSGQGKLLAGCYGAIEERILQPGQKYTVDTGHIVGFDGSVQFSVRRVGGWKSTVLSGEGLVCELTGPGRVLMQTRSEEAFLGWLIPKIPSSRISHKRSASAYRTPGERLATDARFPLSTCGEAENGAATFFLSLALPGRGQGEGHLRGLISPPEFRGHRAP